MNPSADATAIAEALDRVADALLVLAGTGMAPKGDPYPATLAPTDEIEDLPPVRQVDLCPIHKTPWKTVPAGTSKRTGKPYSAFRACSTAGCDQRP